MSLAKDFAKLLESGNRHDIVITAGSPPDTQAFRAHMIVLQTRCPYFEVALSKPWLADGEPRTFVKPNVRPAVFKLVLSHIYTDKVDYGKDDGSLALGLLIAADELCLSTLVENVQERLIRSCSRWINNNLVRVCNISVHVTAAQRLSQHCLNTIESNPAKLFEADNLGSLQQVALASILKNGKLRPMSEAKVWAYTVKWCVAQHPSVIQEKVDKWTTKQFAKLGESLDPLRPLIRFYDMTRQDFFYEVRPYRQAFDPGFFEELECFFYTDKKNIRMLDSRCNSYVSGESCASRETEPTASREPQAASWQPLVISSWRQTTSATQSKRSSVNVYATTTRYSSWGE